MQCNIYFFTSYNYATMLNTNLLLSLLFGFLFCCFCTNSMRYDPDQKFLSSSQFIYSFIHYLFNFAHPYIYPFSHHLLFIQQFVIFEHCHQICSRKRKTVQNGFLSVYIDHRSNVLCLNKNGKSYDNVAKADFS